MDDAYIRDAGQAVAHYVVGRSRPCELAYTPGNGTLYELVFTPLGPWSGCTDPARDWMDHEKRRSVSEDRPEWADPDREGLLLLSWLGHGAWPVDLRAVWHPPYLVEKYHDCSEGDAVALRSLLVEISSASRLGPAAVVR